MRKEDIVQKQKSFFTGRPTKTVIAKPHRIVSSHLQEWAVTNQKKLKKYANKIAFRNDKIKE